MIWSSQTTYKRLPMFRSVTLIDWLVFKTLMFLDLFMNTTFSWFREQNVQNPPSKARVIQCNNSLCPINWWTEFTITAWTNRWRAGLLCNLLVTWAVFYIWSAIVMRNHSLQLLIMWEWGNWWVRVEEGTFYNIKPSWDEIKEIIFCLPLGMIKPDLGWEMTEIQPLI